MEALTNDYLDQKFEEHTERILGVLDQRLEEHTERILSVVKQGFDEHERRFERIERQLEMLTQSVDKFLKFYTELNQEFAVLRKQLKDLEHRFDELEARTRTS